MFGGNKSTFGNNSGFSAFNTSQPSTFNQSAFAKPATSTFGSSFGQTQNTMFGAAPQPTGGLFGGSATTQTPGFGTFGQPQQQQQQTSLFGQTQNPPTSSVFGTQQTSLFGASKPTGFAFSQQSMQQPTNTMFSSQPQPTQGSFFGQPQTSTGGVFGSSATSTFGAAPTTAFGQSTSTQGLGTSIAKFNPPQESETMQKGSSTSYVQTKQQCVTFMKEYADKSLEELRIEDYAANRKGPQAGSTMFSQPTGGVFGSTATQPAGGSLFGATQTAPQTGGMFGGGATFGQQTSTFGQTNTMFGKPLTAPASTTAPSFGGFGATNTSTFGAAKPFGAPTTSTGLFGQSQPSTFGATTNTFGQTQNTFGAAPQQSGSLFGSTATATAAPFGGLGTSQPSTAFNFSQPNNTSAGQPGSLFGAAAKPTGFGTSTFGAPTSQPASTFTGFSSQPTAGTSLFNQPKPFSFGQSQPAATPAVSFGGTGGSLFGNTSTQQTGGLFGNTSTLNTGGGGLFGSSQPSAFGATQGGGLSFGLQQSSGGLFGQNQPQQQAQQPSQEIHSKILSLASNPYGDNELFKGLKPITSEDSLKVTNPAVQKALLESSSNYKVSPSSSSKIRVKPITVAGSKKSLFDGLEEHDASLEDSFSLKTNPKRLIIKPKSASKPSNDESAIFNRSAIDEPNITDKRNESMTESFSNQIPLTQPQNNELDNDRRVSWLRTAPSQGIRQRSSKVRDSGADTTLNQIVGSANRETENIQQQLDNSQILSSTMNDTFRSENDMNQSEIDESIIESNEPHPTGIILRRAGYYTIPSLDELAELMDKEGRCVVPYFTVGRKGYGNVYFDEEIDVAGLNLDEICFLRNKEIVLYPDDDNKPPVGEGLNRKAQVTLDSIWPRDATTRELIKDVDRLEAMDYEAKLRRNCAKRGATFLEYRPETGSCVFKVKHFSKYTLDDSDDEDDNEPRADPKKAKIVAPVQNNGKLLLDKGKENQPIQNNETFNKSKPIDTTFFLGQHMGQRGFQQTFIQEDDDIQIARDATSPSILLAKEMKADSHKLQLMKASLFVDDDEDDRMSTMSDRTDGRDSPEQIVPTTKSIFSQRLLLPSSKLIDEDMIHSSVDKSDKSTIAESVKKSEIVHQPPSKPIGPVSADLIIRPRVFHLDINMMLPMKDSILKPMISKQNNTVPFFHGRRFKISFGHGNNFTILGSQFDNDSLFNGRQNDDASKPFVKILKLKSMKDEKNEEFKKSIINHLEIELKHDKRIQVENSDCPRLEANGGTDALYEHQQLAQKLLKDNPNNQNHFNATVWSLIHALWGFIEDEVDSQGHAIVMLRRDLLSSWIESVVTENDKLKANVDYLDRLLNMMMCHKVTDACELALSNDDFNLSLLLSQSSGGQTIRQLVQHQLANWHEVEADQFIDERRIKSFMMVGGVSVMEGPHSSTVNIFEGLEWLKCLALQLWYISSPVSSVTDAVLAYEENFNQNNFEVSSPIPPYVKEIDRKDFPYFDIRFHLLKLFSQRSQPLEQLLHTSNYTSDSMDYRLAFLVHQTLETLGYCHLSESCRLKIFTSLSEQLESYGMWEWSIWVLMHIVDKNHRELAIQRLLFNHIQIDGANDKDNYVEKEKFLIESLMIPEKWISYAKAIRAGALGAHSLELKYLLKAQQWTKAHEILIQHIAPDLVINDQYDFLKSILLQFEDTKDIQNWKTQGEILLTFIELNEKFKELSENVGTFDEEIFLDQISQKLSDLCSVIRLFPCPTPKHRLTQCEIAKELAFIIRNFYANSSAFGSQGNALLRSALERLPLPQEYAHQELKYVLKSFMMEKLSLN